MRRTTQLPADLPREATVGLVGPQGAQSQLARRQLVRRLTARPRARRCNLFFTNARVASACADGVSLGAVKCQSVQVLSDRETKQDISGPIDPDECLQNVISLQPKEYCYKSRPTEKRRGLVAQEVPKAFTKRGDDGYLRVNVYDLLCEVIGSIKALERKVSSKGGGS